MPASATDYFSKAYQRLTTTLSADKGIGVASMTLNSATNWPTTYGVKASVYALDANGDIDVATFCVYRGTVSGSQITNLTLVEGTDQLHSAGATVSLLFTATHWNDVMDGLLISHDQDGTLKAGAVDVSAVLADDVVTRAKVLDASQVEMAGAYAPQGYLVNGKISRTVATNDITVAIKTLAGTDPSASDPVYCRIGDTVRAITSALSVTKNDGTNWFNSGSAEHATQEIDYFVYLGWNATAGEVVIGFSRISHGRVYSDFSATTTSDTYCAINNITGAAAGNEYENVGRFNAILSATAAFNWSVPGTSVIVNRPIFETRELVYVPTLTNMATGNGTLTARYKIREKRLIARVALVFGTTSTITGDVSFTTPISTATYVGTGNLPTIGNASFFDTSAGGYFYGVVGAQSATAVSVRAIKSDTTYGSVGVLSSLLPMTWATGDELISLFEKELA